MKVLHITAGAGNMYCGSCLRDNTLAMALRAAGHDVILLPVYTPTHTDEANGSSTKVFFGGIGVYLQQSLPLFRKLPRFLDKLWDSSFALKQASKSTLPVDPKFLGEMTLSMLRGERGALRREFDKLTEWLEHEPPPDIVNITNSLLIGMAEPIRRTLKRPVCCTLQGEDLFLEGLEERYRSQALDLIRKAVQHVDLFIAVSEYCGELMREYLQIPDSKLRVVPIGINAGRYSNQRQRDDSFRIGYFARVCPEKGLHNLCDAFALLRREHPETKMTLEAAGYLAPEHEGYLSKLKDVEYKGSLEWDDKVKFLGSLDAFSVPADYVETKGISVLEAMASGVPVVQPRHGAYIEMIEHTGGGILVEPKNPRALADALWSVWADPAMAARLGEQGGAGVRERHTAERMARETAAAMESVTQACAGQLYKGVS